VALRVRFLQVGDGELRVVLQGVEVLVAEQLLHVLEVRAPTDQLGRARPAEGVRCHRDRQRETLAVQAHALQERVIGQRLARACEPERTLAGVAHEERANAAQVARHEAQRGLPDGQDALLAGAARGQPVERSRCAA